MARSLPFLAALLAGPLAAAGCAAPGPFPSLLPRDVERAADALEEPVRVAPEVPRDPALAARAAELLAALRAGDRAFAAALPAAESAAAAAGAAESESWILAQQLLSRLEAARGETMRALLELDRLALARADMATAAADDEALRAALAEAERVAAAQQARLDALRNRLARS